MNEKGVDFRHHIYVPEVDMTNGATHHERAAHVHLLKRIAHLCAFRRNDMNVLMMPTFGTHTLICRNIPNGIYATCRLYILYHVYT